MPEWLRCPLYSGTAPSADATGVIGLDIKEVTRLSDIVWYHGIKV